MRVMGRSYCLMQKEGAFARENPHRNWAGVEWVGDGERVTGMARLRSSLHSSWQLKTCFSLSEHELVVQFHHCRVSFQSLPLHSMLHVTSLR